MELLGGPLFGVAGAGESHGPAVTTIVFGCPPGLYMTAAEIQQYLDRRRPGSNKHGTPRREDDTVVLLSGLYQADHEKLAAGLAIRVTAERDGLRTSGYAEGYTTGEPIAAVVLSTAKSPRTIVSLPGRAARCARAHRPGQALQVAGFRGRARRGRSSYRSTISDVIGGSIARLLSGRVFGTAILRPICQVGH